MTRPKPHSNNLPDDEVADAKEWLGKAIRDYLQALNDKDEDDSWTADPGCALTAVIRVVLEELAVQVNTEFEPIELVTDRRLQAGRRAGVLSKRRKSIAYCTTT
jgi:hypothetical protein